MKNLQKKRLPKGNTRHLTAIVREGKSRKPEKKVQDLNTAEDGKASEKAHRASILGLHRHLTQIQVVNTLILHRHTMQNTQEIQKREGMKNILWVSNEENRWREILHFEREIHVNSISGKIG